MNQDEQPIDGSDVVNPANRAWVLKMRAEKAAYDARIKAGGKSDFELLSASFEQVGIQFTKRTGSDGYRYIFIKQPLDLAMRIAGETIDTAPLDSLLGSLRYFEFEDGRLVSY